MLMLMLRNVTTGGFVIEDPLRPGQYSRPDQLDSAAKNAALDLIRKNLSYLLGVYQQPTTNLWEEHEGFSFFARSVQLRCLREIAANTIGIVVPHDLQAAALWLEAALQAHWNGTYYVSLMVPGSNPPRSVADGYDANSDIACACVYGAIPCTDTKLLATAALLREQWLDPASPTMYPINGALASGCANGRLPGPRRRRGATGPPRVRAHVERRREGEQQALHRERRAASTRRT
jgi:glucoamylase